MASLDVGKKLDSFTGVVVHAGADDKGDDLDFTVGSSSGYVLDITNPIGTKEMAAGVLAGLKLRGYRYQPYEASSALLDPAAEIGDNVTVNGTTSIICNRTLYFSPLMAADIGAPYDEEVNHAFKYEAAMEREFKRESKYTRSRIKQNKDSIQLEVVRATDAENALGARIDVRLNSISLSVSGTDGTSVFKIMDGSTTLNTTSFDISVKAMNVNGQLTASQIATGAISVGKLDADAKSKVVKSSITKTQYLLHTSSSTLPANPNWLDTMPTWESGKYLWTRQVTTDTYLDDSTVERSTNGKYDENLTTALSTATAAQTTGLQERENLYHSIGPNDPVPSAPQSWVTNATGNQGVWTTVRPEYSSQYPALYICTQKKTVSGTVTFTAVKLDVTTTVIDGSHITTGTIDAQRINVGGDLSAFGATIAGWKIENTRLSKGGGASDLLRVQFNAPASPSDTTKAIDIASRASTTDGFATKFSVTYGGKLYAKDAQIEGKIVATSGTIGGLTIGDDGQGNPQLHGIGTGNLSSYCVGGVGGGVNFNNATKQSGYTAAQYFWATYLRASSDLEVGGYFSSNGTLRVNGSINNANSYMYIGGYYCSLQTITIDGTTYHLLGYVS